MIVRIIKKTRIYNFTLPTKINGNYWITDNDFYGNSRNLINVEAYEGKWRIKSNFETKIVTGAENKEIETATLKEYNLFYLKINGGKEFLILYCSPSVDSTNKMLKIKGNCELIIGNDSQSQINYNYPLVSRQHAKLTYNNGSWMIMDLNSKYGTYVNNFKIQSSKLKHGDIIFIMGLKIIVLSNVIIINDIGNYIRYDKNYFEPVKSLVQQKQQIDEVDKEIELEFYKQEDYFYRAPRFITSIEPVNIKIDAPPERETPDDTPLIYVVGPMVSMGMISVVMMYSALNGVNTGTRTISDSMPTIIMALAMLSTMLLWPLLSKRYQRKKQKKKEAKRQLKYKEYIDKKREQIHIEMTKQRQILLDNNVSLEECKNIVMDRKRNLWEREIDQDDFLSIRLGIGTSTLEGNISYPEEKFSVEDDNLKDMVYNLGKESKELSNVPICLSFVNNNISAIIGDGKQKSKFVEGLLLRIMTYHSYEDLKIIVLTNDTNKNKWDFTKVSPHNWNNDKTIRYFGINHDEYKEISLYLEQIFQKRKFKDDNDVMTINEKDYKYYLPYFLIITDDFKAVRDIEIVNDVVNQKINVGFSLIIINNRLTNLPNDCKTFISIGDVKSGIFENELISNKQKEFIADYDENIDIYSCSKRMFNIPIDITVESGGLPLGLSFLEMYDVGKIEQLNILSRWKNNDPTKSLQVPIGVDKSKEMFKLDLHEKYYGPHGLVAGMTGSGKSEFLITYILSMCINFSPDEVTFIIIDYKGGGLAGVFENKETGLMLPHLAGTITNLDTVEINRSLASIQSELRRRQKVFNEARDNLNESTIDIYKYQRLYREGLVKEPVSHLFIISDEFAELKTQKPEFMDQLISTARIGRSLGVHLILATQKPGGIVNDQIWSNSKFRVCLRVQDKTDSMDMIKCPDAALIKNPGRFYLQVGYNELFALGQAAWCGAQYFPTEKRKKKIDSTLDFIDNIGNVAKKLDSTKKQSVEQSRGEELPNIVKYIVETANSVNAKTKKLWLDRIPDFIYVEDLKRKYNYEETRGKLNPIIGEYDDPSNQKQGILTLSLSQEGNTIIYGSAGSGKENLLNTIIYSIITNHTTEEVNLYLLDFGAETLTSFRDAPQVGDVILSMDKDKIENLFKLLTSEVEKRKKLFSEYNGNYSFYCEHSGRIIPAILIIINNYESFEESYIEYQEEILKLTRDALKYGIIFIFSTNAVNAIKYRLRQNFKQNLVLQFNDSTDYYSIFGNLRGREPSKVMGRGFIDLGEVYEFQTAYPYTSNLMTEYLKVISKKLNTVCPVQAPKISVLPEVVDMDYIRESITNVNLVPVGVYKNNLNIAKYNFSFNTVSIITSNDVSNFRSFINIFLKVLYKMLDKNLIVCDALETLQKIDFPNINIININFDQVFTVICEDIENQYKLFEESKFNKQVLANYPLRICTIIGFEKFKFKLSAENKTKFNSMMEKAIMLETYKFVIISDVDRIKEFSYEEWFKKAADCNNGIWLGNGIANQFVLKATGSSRALGAEIGNNFGYIVLKGKPALIKIISEESIGDNNG